MANITDVEKFFPTPSEEYSSTLSSSIVAGAEVVPVVNAAAYEDGDIVVLIVDPKTVNEAVFTGTKASNPDRFIDCVWTEGNVGVGHAPGAVIADYVTATHLAMVTKGLSKSHNQDGTLKAGGAWTTWTPSWGNVVVGNGQVVARYTALGKTVAFNLLFTLGSTSSVTGDINFTLPTASEVLASRVMNSSVRLADDSTSKSYIGVALPSGSSLYIRRIFNGEILSTSSTLPFVWAASDYISVSGSYEAI